MVSSAADVLTCLGRTTDLRRRRMAEHARGRIEEAHSHLCRAEELERYVEEARRSGALTG